MRTTTLQQTVTFKASPHQVYNMLRLEEASVAVGRARENQPQGWRKIHSLGIAHIWNQLGAEARQKNRASMACHRMVAGSLLGGHL
jgi:hypothetical protein